MNHSFQDGSCWLFHWFLSFWVPNKEPANLSCWNQFSLFQSRFSMNLLDMEMGQFMVSFSQQNSWYKVVPHSYQSLRIGKQVNYMVHGKYLQYSSLGLWSNRHNRGAPPCIGTIQLLILVRQLYPINITINIISLNLILNCQLKLILTFEKRVMPNIQLLRYIYHWAVLTNILPTYFSHWPILKPY